MALGYMLGLRRYFRYFPKAVLSLRFHLCYVRCCSAFKCYNFNTSVCPIIQFSEVNLVATCFGRSCLLGLSSVLSLFVKICLFIFPFDV